MLCPTCTTWRNGGTNPEPVPTPPMPARAKDMVLEDAVGLAVGTLTDGDHHAELLADIVVDLAALGDELATDPRVS